ncbi:MAG: transcription-repair coupling factor [Verrucomicrobia bacterium]|nr:transcription-repair coupling factor [Verrucomicrobiota bacterium]
MRLFEAAANTPALGELIRRLGEERVLSVAGVGGSTRGFLTVLLRRLRADRPLVLVVENVKTQEALFQDIQSWLRIMGGPVPPDGQSLLFYPAWEVMPSDSRLPHADVISERLETLVRLGAPSATAPIVVTTAVALMQRTWGASALRERTRRLARGSRVEPLDLVEWLEEQAYEPEAQVGQKGEIALRGGILDVYPPTSPWPVRLEFFGDELESLRHFDPHSQLSKEAIETVTLPPAGELGLLRQADVSLETATLLEHLPADALWLLCEPEALALAAEQYLGQFPGPDPLVLSWAEVESRWETSNQGRLELFETPSVESAVALDWAALETFRPLAAREPDPQVAELRRREFIHQLHRWLRQGTAVHVVCNNEGERRRFTEIWAEYRLDSGSDSAAEAGHHPQPVLHLGALTGGFACEAGRFVVVTDAEIFGRYKVQRPRRLKSPHAAAARSALEIDFTELSEGDYVVHVQHGIGRYLGLRVLPVASGRRPTARAADPAPSAEGQECLVIEYAPREPDQEPPKLYVPVTESHLVSKYVGAGRAQPPLNTLGGTRWANAKAKAEEAIRDFAGELLAIQAARDSQVGQAFPTDVPWQREFESSFVYEETPDQLRAIEETKRDLESARPMDRLICGDVGFGKTEVAIRAAFKAVMSGKQVAVLVPTTVLAQQHFKTFRERMADYPVRIELLSRFRTRAQQQRAIRELAQGAVDIVIGTHRLVQSDVTFKELGLVVIDEEQRFGVIQKETFKQMRRLVDVLTLSATPIPRTLYLALTGARDMSTIETPPQDRLPVETIVTPYDERVIRDAIQRELNRGGQVFFLHNRVTSIELIAQRLKTLVPQARLVVGHGQMHSDDLEEVMTRFVEGEADVLLSTTIIESGIDIPNANTIIIDRADRFGLSDLYQLRGRVGRYKHQAYAYFLLPRHAGLLADARKRIGAIRQYSSLGSGFKIAMRDLEIRGAGNLLGPEQSGHITAVGFELYCQLLKQSISRLKGETVKPRIDVQARFDFLALSPGEESTSPVRRSASGPPDSLLPDPRRTPAAVKRSPAFVLPRYVSDARQRIEIYRKLAQATDKTALDRLRSEIRDRFGPPPAALELLFLVAELKQLAGERGISTIEVRDDRLMLMRQGDYLTTGGKFPRLTKSDARGKLREIRRLLLVFPPLRHASS